MPREACRLSITIDRAQATDSLSLQAPMANAPLHIYSSAGAAVPGLARLLLA